MPGFMRPKERSPSPVDGDDKDSIKSSSSTMKHISGRVAKGVKKQIKKLDEVYHHVTHTQHRQRTKSSPNLSSTAPFLAVRAHTASPKKSRDSWISSKLVKELSLTPSETSIGSGDTTPPPSAPLALPVMAEEQEPIQISVAVVEQPEVRDTFLEDEEGDAESEQGSSTDVDALSPSPPSHNVSLTDDPEPQTQSEIVPPPPALVSPAPNLNKDIPPPPASALSEEELPEVYLPAIIAPSLFLPIPNTDPLTTLLNKYIYPPDKRPTRDVTGDWQRSDFHTLVMTNSWRALARMARDRLLVADPSDLTLILSLWHLRLSCLARLRLFNQTSAECTNLFSVLNSIEPPEAKEYVFERILPFELEVMQTRLKYWAGDHMGYLDALSALLNKCKSKCRLSGSDPILVPMWKERGARVCLIIASQMIEMKEFTAAAHLLEPLCSQTSSSSTTTTNAELRSSIARIYLQGGNVEMAEKHFMIVNEDPEVDQSLKQINAALLAAAEGEWEEASEALRGVLEKDEQNYVAVNNLSVALLSQGKLKEGIEVLEKALKSSPSSVVVAEPFLFNLSTLYELRSNLGFEKKKDLLLEVAKWSGDGLKTNCLKMPLS